jgi:hypothetical protein
MTKELPWNNNIRGMSCIPDGDYLCVKFISTHFGTTYKLQYVPGREDIEFHWGSYLKDIRGCILVGNSTATENGEILLLNTKVTHSSFIKEMGGIDSFFLSIKSVTETAYSTIVEEEGK